MQRVVKLTDDGQIVARCPKCRAEVPVPWLRVDQSAVADAPKRRRLVMRAPLDTITPTGESTSSD